MRYTAQAFAGMCRSMHTWATLRDETLTAIGTSSKYYVEDSGDVTDITPIRDTVTLGSNPITTSSGSGIVTIADTNHGAQAGDYVIISGATAFNDLTTGQLNQEFVVLTVPDVDTFTVDTGGTANASSSGGGASVQVQYLLGSGGASSSFGSGWGAGAWGRGTWSSAAEVTTLSASLRLWSQSNYGEDLLFAPRYGPIYRFDSSAGGRGALISAEGGANEVPTTVTEILVAPNERIVLALGCNEIGGSDHDELLIRWSDYENYLEWEPTSTTAAGGFRLQSGSRIITGLLVNREILIWTDTTLFGLSFVGSTEAVFQSYIVEPMTDIIGPLAKAAYGSAVYWMGSGGFYVYDGRARPLFCPVEDYVFNDLNIDQQAKVACGTNAKQNEVWWLYPSLGSEEPNKYVIYNVLEDVWYYGTIDRTFWLDRGLFSYPRAASTDGYIYTHEFGVDDGSTTPASAIESYVVSAPVEMGGNEDMGRGDRIAFVNKLVPDVTFRNSTGAMPTLTYTFMQRDYPGLAYEEESSTIDKGATVDRYTKKKSIRLRARALALKVYNNEVGTDWRIGVQRFEARTDGRKT